MTDDPNKVFDQLEKSRFRNGRHERLENGEWKPWPVLKLDEIGRIAAARDAALVRERRR
jgi:hypothetical protein